MGAPNRTSNTPSRRRFLGLASAASTATLLDVMTGAAPASAVTGRQTRPAQSGQPTQAGGTVAILGAGPAGLGAALSLLDAGFDVTILEAQGRVGGRTLSARPGDEISEVWDDGVRTQTCRFDEGLYLNLGAGRIPYHHYRVLSLCRRLGVPLEVYVHTSTANLFQTDDVWGGAPRHNRRIANDTRGYVAQFAADAVAKGTQAEDGLTPEQREQFLRLLTSFGQLDPIDHSYHGSTRSGLAHPLTVQQLEEPVDPLRLADLLAARFWDYGFYQDSDYKWQTTSFQPVGGMDQIWRYAAGALPAGTLRLHSPVTAIALDGDGVVVGWTDENGSPSSGRFDYCLSNIPMSVLRAQVEMTGFDAAYTTAVNEVPFAASCKVGWQANRRFWESERHQIFGGISRNNRETTQIWYPSNDYFSPTDRGTLTGAYAQYDNAVRLGGLPHEERLVVAREAGVRIHEEFASEAIIPNDLGMSITWDKVPYQLGAWAWWQRNDPQHKGWYQTLLYPQGQDNFLVIGDQVSVLPGWQEGALMSAEWAHQWLTGPDPAARTRAPVREVPDARELTEGLG
ncbi:flavin monoamine oxidase family protein [Streptomyces sp. 4N509B]|uniref:flavin monoamine oxidase family protein n=1 Tax=Streptomyces sp. 4N509B TaxID=3457413 RepID=UPI003FD30EE3